MGSGLSIPARKKDDTFNDDSKRNNIPKSSYQPLDQQNLSALPLEAILSNRLHAIKCNNQNPKDKVNSYREFIRELKTEYKSSGNKNIKMLIAEAYNYAGSLYLKHGDLNHAIQIFNSAIKYGKAEAAQTIKLINGLLISNTQNQSYVNPPLVSADPKNIIFSDITGTPTSNNVPVNQLTDSKKNAKNKPRKLHG